MRGSRHLLYALMVVLPLTASAASVALAAAAPVPTAVDTQTPYPTGTPYPTNTAQPTPLPVHRPALVLSSATGKVDAPLLVAASDFPAGGSLLLLWDNTPLARLSADAGGYVLFTVHVPRDATLGPHEVRAIGPDHTSAGALFTVQTYSPALTLSPTQGITGTQVVVQASGYVPGASVALYWDKRDPTGLLGILVADGQGTVRHAFAVGEPRATLTTPLRATPGAHTVYAIEARPIALESYAPFVVPALVLGPGGPKAPDNPCNEGEFALPIPLPVVGGTVCVPTTSFIGDILSSLASLLVGAVGTVMSPFVNSLTVEPRIDRSVGGSDLWRYAYGLGLGIAASFYTLAGLHYLRNATRRDFEPFFTLQDAVIGGLFVAGQPLWMSVVFGTGQWLTDRIKGHVGQVAMSALGKVFSDLVLALTGNPAMAIVDVLTGVLMFIFGFLVGLIRLVGVYGLGWLYIVSAMAMATWIYPPTRGIAVRWFQAFCAVLLWPAGWAVSLQVIAVVWLWLPTSDAAWNNPLLEALSSVGALVLLFVTPRLVDMLIGTGIAGVSGAYTLSEGVIGGLIGAAAAKASAGKKGT